MLKLRTVFFSIEQFDAINVDKGILRESLIFKLSLRYLDVVEMF